MVYSVKSILILLIGLNLILPGSGQGAKKLNEKLDAFITSFKSTVQSVDGIEKTVRGNVDPNDLIKMLDVNDLRVNVDVFKSLLKEFEDFQADISKGLIKVPSRIYLSKLANLYKQINIRRGEFAEFDERQIFSGFVAAQKLKDQRKLFNERSKEILAILLKLAEMEENRQGSVIPGLGEKEFTLDKLSDNMKPVFQELMKTAIKSIKIMEDIENIYTDLVKYVGSSSSPPYTQITYLFESASDVIAVLARSAEVFLVTEKRKIIRKKALKWYNGADGYFEFTTRLDEFKKLLLQISQYRDLRKWQNIKPQDFLDDSLKRIQMVFDERTNIKSMIDEL